MSTWASERELLEIAGASKLKPGSQVLTLPNGRKAFAFLCISEDDDGFLVLLPVTLSAESRKELWLGVLVLALDALRELDALDGLESSVIEARQGTVVS